MTKPNHIIQKMSLRPMDLKPKQNYTKQNLKYSLKMSSPLDSPKKKTHILKKFHFVKRTLKRFQTHSKKNLRQKDTNSQEFASLMKHSPENVPSWLRLNQITDIPKKNVPSSNRIKKNPKKMSRVDT